MTTEIKNCKNCSQDFEIRPEDFDFYEKIKVPPPTWCPECRLQRRLIWRNEKALYKRKCDLCSKEIIAMYPQDVPFPVYCRECWYSDKWEPKEYGKEYDFSKTFFEQFVELLKTVPRVSIQVSGSVNSDYSNQIANCKNCYLISSGSDNEDSAYTFRVLYSKRAVDGIMILRCENIYESIECLGASNTMFTEDCADSLGMKFCLDARTAQDCFMSSNLRRVSHIFRGVQLSKEEYENKIKQIDTGSYRVISELKKEFEELKKKSIRRFANERNCVNSVGHTMSNVKDSYACFNVADVENCRYVMMVNDTKDSMDVNNGCCQQELVYETCTSGVKSANVKMSVDAWPELRDSEYCDTCRDGSHDLFGCIGMRGEEFCILNKPYSKKDYREMISRIKQQMSDLPYLDRRGVEYKYGEFFPPELSVFPYWDSPAQDYFPLTENQVKENHWPFRELTEKHPSISLDSENIPDNIKDVSDSILTEIIGCAHKGDCHHRCTKAFRLIPDELGFYREMNLPIPRLCPNCRHYERFARRNPPQLFKDQCDCAGLASKNNRYSNKATHAHGEQPCGKEFETSYRAGHKEIVYCADCYSKEVV